MSRATSRPGWDRFSTDTSALATENLDVDLDGAGALLDAGALRQVRIKAESNDGKPLFVGIARTSDVSDYLRGSSHALITDVDYSPVPRRLPHPGTAIASPAPPGAQQVLGGLRRRAAARRP